MGRHRNRNHPAEGRQVADYRNRQQNKDGRQTSTTHVEPQQNNSHQENNMQMGYIMREHETPFESHNESRNGFINKTTLTFTSPHKVNTHNPTTSELNKQQHENATGDT